MERKRVLCFLFLAILVPYPITARVLTENHTQRKKHEDKRFVITAGLGLTALLQSFIAALGVSAAGALVPAAINTIKNTHVGSISVSGNQGQQQTPTTTPPLNCKNILGSCKYVCDAKEYVALPGIFPLAKCTTPKMCCYKKQECSAVGGTCVSDKYIPSYCDSTRRHLFYCSDSNEICC